MIEYLCSDTFYVTLFSSLFFYVGSSDGWRTFTSLWFQFCHVLLSGMFRYAFLNQIWFICGSYIFAWTAWGMWTIYGKLIKTRCHIPDTLYLGERMESIIENFGGRSDLMSFPYLLFKHTWVYLSLLPCPPPTPPTEEEEEENTIHDQWDCEVLDERFIFKHEVVFWSPSCYYLN